MCATREFFGKTDKGSSPLEVPCIMLLVQEATRGPLIDIVSLSNFVSGVTMESVAPESAHISSFEGPLNDAN